jgi:hypothetical protein
VVHPYPHGSAIFSADLYQRQKTFPGSLQLGHPLAVSELLFNEGGTFVGVVTRIDAYFFNDSGCHLCRGRVEMNIGADRRVETGASQFVFDVQQVLRLAHSLGSQSHQLTSCLDDADALADACRRIKRVGICHALHPDWQVATH